MSALVELFLQKGDVHFLDNFIKVLYTLELWMGHYFQHGSSPTRFLQMT